MFWVINLVYDILEYLESTGKRYILKISKPMDIHNYYFDMYLCITIHAFHGLHILLV